MHALARPKPPAIAAGAAGATRPGRPRPSRPSDPTWSRSRRVRPSQSLFGPPRIRIMATSNRGGQAGAGPRRDPSPRTVLVLCQPEGGCTRTNGGRGLTTKAQRHKGKRRKTGDDPQMTQMGTDKKSLNFIVFFHL